MSQPVNFLKEATALYPLMVTWRRKLHQIPETGTQLPQTMAYICERLNNMGIPYRYNEKFSCVIATIGSGSKCFLLRSDADALPIKEEADVHYKSTNGCMHGCGHDLHTTMLLGAARILKSHEKELNGTVKLLFQSGEEEFKGAKAAISAGVLEHPHVDAALAMHVIAMLPLGVVMTGKEPMASVDGFRITVTGKGGHGSMPEACVDPINAAVQIYLALQSLMAREVGGTEEAVLTIGQLNAGDAPNIIPERAVLQGTLRTFGKDLRNRLMDRIRQISTIVAAAYRCEYRFDRLFDCSGVVTDDDITESVEKSLHKLLPDIPVIKNAHGMGSEDFAEITCRVPSAYFMLGAGPDNEARRFGQHNPKIEFNEKVLLQGAALYAQAAMDWLAAHSQSIPTASEPSRLSRTQKMIQNMIAQYEGQSVLLYHDPSNPYETITIKAHIKDGCLTVTDEEYEHGPDGGWSRSTLFFDRENTFQVFQMLWQPPRNPLAVLKDSITYRDRLHPFTDACLELGIKFSDRLQF